MENALTHKSHKLLNNKNLVINLVSYLNTKDLAQVSQTSSKFHKYTEHFDYLWKQEYQTAFCSNYDCTR